MCDVIYELPLFVLLKKETDTFIKPGRYKMEKKKWKINREKQWLNKSISVYWAFHIYELEQTN